MATAENNTPTHGSEGNHAIMPFLFEGKPVRVIQDAEGDPWFVAPDACRILELANVTMALRILDEDEKGLKTVETLGGAQAMNCMSEPGLYKLMGRSRKPEAKRFDRWVRHEVLPAIRRDGGYMMVAPDETPEALALRAMQVLHATVERQKAQLADALPKADALDRIATAGGSLGLMEAAKALQVRPIDLRDYLAGNGWIYRRAGSKNWLGYAAHTNCGDLEHKVSTAVLVDGTEVIREQVKITPRGLAKLAKIFDAIAQKASH